jgi:Neugrin
MNSSISRIYQTCIRPFTARHYSVVSARDKWRLEGIPRPRSILEDDDAVIDLSEDNEVVNGANPNTPPPHLRRPSGEPTPLQHKLHRETIRKEFPEGWAPPRKLSREAMDAVRQLYRLDPKKFNTPMIADKFKISPEAVRRILKSKWEPSAERRAALAIKQRKEKDEIMLERRQKELREAQNLRELRKDLRNKDNHDWDGEQGHGLSPTDRFTFR